MTRKLHKIGIVKNAKSEPVKPQASGFAPNPANRWPFQDAQPRPSVREKGK